MNNSPNVAFIRVQDNASKVSRIAAITSQQFFQGQPVLILVPNMEAAKYG